MSNGIVTAGCCCGACPTCCNWWSASPAGPVDFTLTFYQNHTMEVLGGQFMQLGYIAWTITATLTKSGNCCNYYACGPTFNNLTRYTANVCEVSVSKVSNIYSYGYTRRTCLEDDITACTGLPGCYCTMSPRACEYTGGFTYDGLLNCTDPCTNYNNSPFEPIFPYYQLGDPCFQWNCKKCNYRVPIGQCECECKTVSELLWKKLYEVRENYNATVFGTGPGPGSPLPCPLIGKPLQAGPNAVITIYCGPNPCGGTCLVPRLIFSPRDQTLVTKAVECDATMNACCPNGYCPGEEPYISYIPYGSCYSTATTSTPRCLPPFELIGKGSSFNSATFTNPISASEWDVTLGFQVQTGTTLWGPGYLAYNFAPACELVNKSAVCQKYAWDNSEDGHINSGSPYHPIYCGNDRLQPIGDNKGCNIVSSRCWGPSWTEKYCMENRSLNSVVI